MVRLAAQCDVLIENYKVDGLAKYGLDYPTLHNELPDLVYCSITGFGQTGPYRQRAGYDYLFQGMGGLMSVTGEEGGRPVKTGPPVADLTSGLYLTIGILAALESRRTSGRGQRVSTSLYESALSLAVWETAELWATGENRRRISQRG